MDGVGVEWGGRQCPISSCFEDTGVCSSVYMWYTICMRFSEDMSVCCWPFLTCNFRFNGRLHGGHRLRRHQAPGLSGRVLPVGQHGRVLPSRRRVQDDL